MKIHIAVVVLALAFVSPASHAQNAVHRCVAGADADAGDSEQPTNFTDQPCDATQVEIHEAPMRTPQAAAPVAVGTVTAPSRVCARNRDDLVENIRSALESHDVNRFAGTYLWTGMGTREAYARMARFQIVANRPLIDAQAPDDGANQVRIDQQHSKSSDETEVSYFQIVPAAGCLWIHD